MLERRSALPTFRMSDVVVRTIRNNQVTIISGDTGEWMDQAIWTLTNVHVMTPFRMWKDHPSATVGAR